MLLYHRATSETSPKFFVVGAAAYYLSIHKISLDFVSKVSYNMSSIRKILMDNLIQELQSPRYLPPSPAALRAAKVIQELSLRADADIKARILAEQKLLNAENEIARLTQELINAKKNNIDNSSVDAASS